MWAHLDADSMIVIIIDHYHGDTFIFIIVDISSAANFHFQINSILIDEILH